MIALNVYSFHDSKTIIGPPSSDYGDSNAPAPQFTFKFCMDENVCLNGGRCMIYGYIFACICPPEYTGVLCETSLVSQNSQQLTCSPNPCQFHSTCVPFVNGTFLMCVCQLGYTGTYCEHGPDPTLTTNAYYPQTSTAPPYVLTLPPNDAYPSYYYTNNNNPSPAGCSPNPCQFHGVCSQFKNGTFYACICQLGYSGYLCEVQPQNTSTPVPVISECEPNPCFNDGICVLSELGKFIGCYCRSSEYTGYYCQHYTRKPCLTSTLFPSLNNFNILTHVKKYTAWLFINTYVAFGCFCIDFQKKIN